MKSRARVTLESLSRRDFLKGSAAIGAAALGGAALAACAPKSEVVSSAASNAKGASEDLPGAAPIPPVSVPEKWDKEADIVVVGTGTGGLNASVLAGEKGASVITIEKLTTPGGSSQHSSVFITRGGSRYQNAVSFPFDPEGVIAKMQVTYQGTVDVPLLRQLVYKGPECVDWMGDQGVKWGLDPQFGPVAHCWEGSCDGDFYPMATKLVTDHMYGVAKDKGVQFLFETSCAALVKDGDRIVGLKATNPKGETLYIHAKKAVILTAGGFAVNRDMLKKYAPSAYEGCAAAYIMPCDTGECTRMGIGAGADMTGFDSFGAFSGGIDDLAQGTGPFHHYLYSGDNQLSRQPWLLIDKMGKRYPYQDSALGTPTTLTSLAGQANIEMSRIGHRGYAIFDSDYETTIFKLEQAGCRRPIVPTMPNVDRMPESVAPHDWKVGVARALERGAIKKSDTIEGLAKELGLDPAVLSKAVEDWNAMCSTGKDPEYGYRDIWLNPVVKAPFYGIRIAGQIGSTKGGLRVNPQMQVIDTKGKVIPGLYAGFHTAGGSTGEVCWNLSILGSNGLSGTSGYIAAENAVQETA